MGTGRWEASRSSGWTCTRRRSRGGRRGWPRRRSAPARDLPEPARRSSPSWRAAGRDGRQLSFCYEAGPCGYGLHRLLSGLGHDCIVVAPSLIPSKPGDRVKTNRRDAPMLAKLHRAGELTAVWVPDAAHEAMRDLVRARATAVRVLGKARQHLQGFLLRHGRIYAGRTRLDPGLPTLADHGPLRPSRPADRAAGLHPRGRGRRGAAGAAGRADQELCCRAGRWRRWSRPCRRCAGSA